MPNILDLAQLAVQAAIGAGVEWAEASTISARSVAAMVDNSSIRECEVVRDCGIGVRAFVRGGMGSATTTALDEGAARQVGEQAAAMARATHGDPEFVALAQPTPYEEVPGRWDDAVAGLPASQVVTWCQQAIEEAKAVAPDAAVSGGADLHAGESALASSTGVAIHTDGTSVSTGFMVVVTRGEDVGAYFEHDTARRLADFVPQGVGRKAAQEALRFLGARQIGKGRLPLVLGPFTAAGLLSAAVGAANAEDVQRGRSCMIGKEGLQIAAPLLTVREEPLIPWGLASGAVDGEGVLKTPRALIDQGVLTTYLHNSYTAHKAKVPYTGHAVRGGYSPGVGIGCGNLQTNLGSRTEAQLISEVEDGLYINYGGLQPEMATGDISGTVDFGFKIEKGQLAYPVATTMIGSNLFELLERIEAISSDFREEPGMIMPSLRIDGIMVVGGG